MHQFVVLMTIANDENIKETVLILCFSVTLLVRQSSSRLVCWLSLRYHVVTLEAKMPKLLCS